MTDELEKLHWCSLSFIGSDESGSQCHASAFSGSSSKLITRFRIESAKGATGLSDDAVMLSATYLGHATKEEIFDEQN